MRTGESFPSQPVTRLTYGLPHMMLTLTLRTGSFTSPTRARTPLATSRPPERCNPRLHSCIS
jgi:hypothetical protein